jgi:hypothetical protein
MSESKLVKCQKCGGPIGYITVLGRGVLGSQQPVENEDVGHLHGMQRQKSVYRRNF